MIPFFEPFTSADGTTRRRPLVDRVPECRPSGLECSRSAVFDQDLTAWRVKNDPVAKALVGGAAVFSDSIAFDLCCMAAIRWLGRAQRRTVFEDICWESDRAGCLDPESCIFPDDAHALNALAHAIADELGIEP